jgi:hypothetical protein
MGLKSGSRDAGLEDDEGEETEETTSAESEPKPESEPESAGGATDSAGAESGDVSSGNETATGTDGRPSMASIPYKLRRSKVNEGREQVPFFLRDEVMDGEVDLKDSLETMLGEQVYKSDYREAAMIVAQRKPELVAEVLREWGYDLD